MFKPKTYLDLCMAMKTRAVVSIDNHKGLVNGISPEDGSGFNWNVTVLSIGGAENNTTTTVFFREQS